MRSRLTLLPGLPGLLGFAFVAAVLLTRTWGIQVDENAYFNEALVRLLGDSRFTGKPPLFYVVNYTVYQLFRLPAGWLHPLILPLFYGAMTTASLWRLAGSAAALDANRRWTFALLLFSPFTLFNATQVMMETAVLPLLTLTMAAALSMIVDVPPRNRGGIAEAARANSGAAKAWLGAAATASVLMKDTAVPALVAIGIAFAVPLKRRVWPLAAGMVIGILGNYLVLKLLLGTTPPPYGGLTQLLESVADPERWQMVPGYTWMWAFFAGAAWLGALYTWVSRRDRWSLSFVVLGILSVIGVLVMRFATNPAFPFPRYSYPVLWVGLAAAAIACARARTAWIPAAVLLVQLPLLTGLWPGALPTLRYWPDAVTSEAYANGGTILSGTPAYGWIAASPRALRDLCVYLPRASAPGADQAILWFTNIARHAGFYDETHADEFERCTAAKVIVDRRFSVDSCDTECTRSLYTIRSCLTQTIEYYSPQLGHLKSRVCLP